MTTHNVLRVNQTPGFSILASTLLNNEWSRKPCLTFDYPQSNTKTSFQLLTSDNNKGLIITKQTINTFVSLNVTKHYF